MKITVDVEGLRECDAALGELAPSTGKGVLRRVLRKRAQPMADDARRRAPRDEGHLQESIGVGTKLTRRQTRQHKKMFADDRSSVEVFVGAGGLPQATLREFGGDGHAPAPYLRPAWDGNKMQILDGLKDDLWGEISTTAKRAATRVAKATKR